MALSALSSLFLYGAARAAPVMMRYPTTSATQLAFVARGDLWVAARDGGRATRMVHSAGHVLASRFSPDGRWIAYTERTAGTQDVYVVAAAGGLPRRLTFDARRKTEANLVVAWTPDSSHVVFLSDRSAWAYKVLQAFSIPLEGGLPERLPLEQSGLLSFSSRGDLIAYTRTFTNFDARKRYIGGQAQDVFTYDLTSRQLTRITDWKGTDTFPMWAGRRIYFLSDRDPRFRANLWCYDLDTHSTRQVTRFEDYDVDWPSLGGDRITFQEAGRLWALDLPNERLHEITVDVPDDGALTALHSLDVGREIRSADATGAVNYALSPHGETAVFAAHGEVFRVAVAGGEARNLTATQSVDEDHPSVSLDGRWVAYVTEDQRAQQVAVRPIAGGSERLLSHFATGVLYTPIFSPDGRWLMVANAEHELWLLTLAGDALRLIARDPVAEIRDAVFSPDGRWLAYSTKRATGLRTLHLYDMTQGRGMQVSSALESDRLPAFSPDGTTLYFVSQRHELPFISDRDDEAALSTLKSDGLYAVSLRGFALASGQAAPSEQQVSALMAQAVSLPVVPALIVSLEVRGSEVIYETHPPSLIGGDLPGETSYLHALDISSCKDRVLLENVNGHALSTDGRHVLYQQDGMWSVAHLDPSAAATPINLNGLKLQADSRAEWREMFERTWRLDRDLFFSPVMNGTDWARVHSAYAHLLPRLGSRDDFVYLLRQLQGELATSHAFIIGLDAGDTTPSVRSAGLGVDLELEPSGRYRISHVYQGDPTRERFRSPVNSPKIDGSGVAVAPGEYLLAINGRDLRAPMNPDSLLVGLTRSVTLTLAPHADGPSREVQISPLSSELNLRQYEWVESNRRRVSELSDGKVGYVFVADFEAYGSEDLVRQLQGQLQKDGLILDVRWNQGGFTSQAVLNLLRRRRAGDFVNREGAIEPLPLFTAPQIMATIANAQSASDGDQFPYFFQAFGLGSVVGERTWGGVQGLKGLWPLMDGTSLTIPKDSLATSDGRWLIENAGVTPDIAVDPQPDEAVTGRDRLLEAAVTEILQKINANPASQPHAPDALPAYPSAGNVPGASFGDVVSRKER